MASYVRSLRLRWRVPASIVDAFSADKSRLEKQFLAGVLEALETSLHARFGDQAIVRIRQLDVRWTVTVSDLTNTEVARRLGEELADALSDGMRPGHQLPLVPPPQASIAVFADEAHLLALRIAEHAGVIARAWYLEASASDTEPGDPWPDTLLYIAGTPGKLDRILNLLADLENPRRILASAPQGFLQTAANSLPPHLWPEPLRAAWEHTDRSQRARLMVGLPPLRGINDDAIESRASSTLSARPTQVGDPEDAGSSAAVDGVGTPGAPRELPPPSATRAHEPAPPVPEGAPLAGPRLPQQTNSDNSWRAPAPDWALERFEEHPVPSAQQARELGAAKAAPLGASTAIPAAAAATLRGTTASGKTSSQVEHEAAGSASEAVAAHLGSVGEAALEPWGAASKLGGLFYFAGLILELDLAQHLWCAGFVEGAVLACVSRCLMGADHDTDVAHAFFSGQTSISNFAAPDWAVAEVRQKNAASLNELLARIGVAEQPVSDEALAEFEANPALVFGENQRAVVGHCTLTLARGFCARLGVPLSARNIRDSTALAARIYDSGEHLDIVMSMNAIDIDIRRAGLDFNPGYLPWLKRNLRLFFKE